MKLFFRSVFPLIFLGLSFCPAKVGAQNHFIKTKKEFKSFLKSKEPYNNLSKGDRVAIPALDNSPSDQFVLTRTSSNNQFTLPQDLLHKVLDPLDLARVTYGFSVRISGSTSKKTLEIVFPDFDSGYFVTKILDIAAKIRDALPAALEPAGGAGAGAAGPHVSCAELSSVPEPCCELFYPGKGGDNAWELADRINSKGPSTEPFARRPDVRAGGAGSEIADAADPEAFRATRQEIPVKTEEDFTKFLCLSDPFDSLEHGDTVTFVLSFPLVLKQSDTPNKFIANADALRALDFTCLGEKVYVHRDPETMALNVLCVCPTAGTTALRNIAGPLCEALNNRDALAALAVAEAASVAALARASVPPILHKIDLNCNRGLTLIPDPSDSGVFRLSGDPTDADLFCLKFNDILRGHNPGISACHLKFLQFTKHSDNSVTVSAPVINLHALDATALFSVPEIPNIPPGAGAAGPHGSCAELSFVPKPCLFYPDKGGDNAWELADRINSKGPSTEPFARRPDVRAGGSGVGTTKAAEPDAGASASDRRSSAVEVSTPEELKAALDNFGAGVLITLPNGVVIRTSIARHAAVGDFFTIETCAKETCANTFLHQLAVYGYASRDDKFQVTEDYRIHLFCRPGMDDVTLIFFPNSRPISFSKK